MPLDAANRPPRLKKQKLILLARTIPGKPGTLQLVASGRNWLGRRQLEEQLRAILSGANSASAPPVVTGVGHAFHVAGSIPGEGETQIFLKTADNRPVSLNIQRHPGEDPRWAVSLGEIVDDSAAAPSATLCSGIAWPARCPARCPMMRSPIRPPTMPRRRAPTTGWCCRRSAPAGGRRQR